MMISKWTVAVVAVLAIMIMPTRGSAQAGRDRVAEGNRLYEEGRFDEAHQMYLEALREDPESSLIRFNSGNALYQTQDFQRAMEAYQQAIDSGEPELASAAWYNLGNSLYRGQQLEPSFEAYKQALRLNPDDVDAKHNLERVLEQMQEQDQQQEGDEQQDQDPQDENDSEQDQEEQDQQNQDGEEDEQQPPEGEDQPPSEGEEESQPQPGEMTPEEAERLLDSIREDPGDVNRKPADARGRKPKKVW
jgi:Ca-activated chloride channel family protein